MNLQDARKMTDVAVAKAEQMGVKVSVVVLDEGGHIVSINRMDGAGYVTAEIALGKASASAAFKRSSAQLQSSAEGKPTFFSGISTLLHGRFLAGQGALPILKDGACLGAVGVSGAKSDEDEAIADDCIKAFLG
jgi:glc operon protein GlcG